MKDDDDVVEIAPSGVVQPVGQRASLRLQGRTGPFHILPSPPDLVVLRRAENARTCLLSGEIKSAGALCDLFMFVAHVAWRGEFIVQEESSTRSIFFDEGHVVGARSNVVKERLGEVLYRYGVLTREQVTTCGDVTADGRGLRFGEVAVKLGLLTRETLFGLMSRQTEEIFYGTLLAHSGTFHFLEGYDEAQLSSRQKLSVSTLVREGIRRMHETRYFRARIPSELHIPMRVAGHAPPENDPNGVYEAIDGERPVHEICRCVGAGEFDVSRALFQLVQRGHVSIRPPRMAPKEMVLVYNDAIALILRELDAMDEGDAVRAQLAKFMSQSAGASLVAAIGGPADDGTLDPAKVATHLEKEGGGAAQNDKLTTWLHEFASYALFLARPHLRRLEQSQANGKPRLSLRVNTILEPLSSHLKQTAKEP